jgi:hypothetical protein
MRSVLRASPGRFAFRPLRRAVRGRHRATSWLQVFPLSGTGNGDLSFRAFPNLALRPRSGKIWVNGTVVTLTQGQAGPNEDERFIALMYFAAFGRYPSPADISFHLSTMTDRAVKAADFFTSDEFKMGGRFIAGIYLGLLRRLPEYGGWLFQRDAVATQGAGAPQALTRNFLQSPEYLAANPSQTNEQFVSYLYTNILGRSPSPADLAFHVSTLGAGDIVARGQKATEFLLVPEYDMRVGGDLMTTLLFFVFFQRDPTAEEFQALRARIPNGISRDQLVPVIRDLMKAADFRALLI